MKHLMCHKVQLQNYCNSYERADMYLRSIRRLRYSSTHTCRRRGQPTGFALAFQRFTYTRIRTFPGTSNLHCNVIEYLYSAHSFIHSSFIHTEHLYSASSRELLRGAPDSCTAKRSKHS